MDENKDIRDQLADTLESACYITIYKRRLLINRKIQIFKQIYFGGCLNTDTQYSKSNKVILRYCYQYTENNHIQISEAESA